MSINTIGILGGTFDPIHNGHLSIAKQLYEALSFSKIDFIPCYDPPHRDIPEANALHRLAMAKLAIQPYPFFSVNTIEIDRKMKSYTINTLRDYRKKDPTSSLCFIIGADAFSQFDTWHGYEEILQLTHVIVVTRLEGVRPYSTLINKLIESHKTEDCKLLHSQPFGHLYFQSTAPTSVSATKIRAALHAKQKNIAGLSPAVENYIYQHNLYK